MLRVVTPLDERGIPLVVNADKKVREP